MTDTPMTPAQRNANGITFLLTAEEKDSINAGWAAWIKLSPAEKRLTVLAAIENAHDNR